MSTLIDLAERCERASGPDRELDVLIWAELDGRDVRRDGDRLLARSRKPPHDECLLGAFSRSGAFEAPRDGNIYQYLTNSIDAAVALCERALPGWWWRVSMLAGKASGSVRDGSIMGADTIEGEAWGKSPALALCAATLRALAAKEKP